MPGYTDLNCVCVCVCSPLLCVSLMWLIWCDFLFFFFKKTTFGLNSAFIVHLQLLETDSVLAAPQSYPEIKLLTSLTVSCTGWPPTHKSCALSLLGRLANSEFQDSRIPSPCQLNRQVPAPRVPADPPVCENSSRNHALLLLYAPSLTFSFPSFSVPPAKCFTWITQINNTGVGNIWLYQ